MFSCHTHSHVGFCNFNFRANPDMIIVVIPTHMWASATFQEYLEVYVVEVVIPTHMWASATDFIKYEIEANESCHTHSHVGFCNVLNSNDIDELTKVVIPTHMWASATNLTNSRKFM